MRVIVQRVSNASVAINGKKPLTIGKGLALLVGFCSTDTKEIVDYLVNKIVNLRVFSDEKGAMNLSLLEIKGELLVVSNFTLYADCRKGRRPSFTEAARPETAIPLYDYFLEEVNKQERPVVAGEFGADMLVSINNDGPVTISLDSAEIMPQKG